MKATERLTLTEWDGATTDERSTWLKEGRLLSVEDAALLSRRSRQIALAPELAAFVRLVYDDITGTQPKEIPASVFNRWFDKASDLLKQLD